jgi:hypothetical protein
MTRSEHWPLRNLVLRTPRLELRPDDDEGLLELVEVADGGVHPAEEMPFTVPWTHLGTVTARSKACTDNIASRRVSDRLGYRPDGMATVARRDRPAQLIRLLLDHDHFVHPNWTVEVDGAEACLSLLGAA